VFNEFEQRFSVSSPVRCFFDKNLSRIDTVDPNRSIFSVYVAGTLTGQTRIRGVGTGLMGVLVQAEGFLESAFGPDSNEYIIPVDTAAVNAHRQGERAAADHITLP